MESYFEGRNIETLAKVESRRFVARCFVGKIGSSSITEGACNGEPLNRELILDHARQYSEMFRDGVGVVVVSSGAVASGKSRLGIELDPKDIEGEQMVASFGQPSLIAAWIEAFAANGVVAGEFLLTRRDIASTIPVLERAMLYGVPIINENDAVSDEEMRRLEGFEDNDELAKLVALKLGADTLALLTDRDGVMDNTGILIENGHLVDLSRLNGKSEVGKGGMRRKAWNAREAAGTGMNAYIARAGYPDIILRIASGTASGICTEFKGITRLD